MHENLVYYCTLLTQLATNKSILKLCVFLLDFYAGYKCKCLKSLPGLTRVSWVPLEQNGDEIEVSFLKIEYELIMHIQHSMA